MLQTPTLEPLFLSQTGHKSKSFLAQLPPLMVLRWILDFSFVCGVVSRLSNKTARAKEISPCHSSLRRNGRIVTASEQYTADIYCEGEQITRIGANLEAAPNATVIDAKEVCVPGLHRPACAHLFAVHGTYSKDTHERRAKRRSSVHDDHDRDGLPGAQPTAAGRRVRVLAGKAEKNSACDFTFHQAVSRLDKECEDQLTEIVKKASAASRSLAYKARSTSLTKSCITRCALPRNSA